MTHYEWERRPIWVPGTEFAEDYDNIITESTTVSFGDELVRAILDINVIDSTQYTSLSALNIQADLAIGFYLHTDNTVLDFQHPRLNDGFRNPTIKALYTGILTPWRYHTFTSPTDPTDHLLYRTGGMRDIESRTQHTMVTSGSSFWQVAIENVSAAATGHTPVFFGWNGHVTLLWRKA